MRWQPVRFGALSPGPAAPFTEIVDEFIASDAWSA
jgi:hypothetical protein